MRYCALPIPVFSFSLDVTDTVCTLHDTASLVYLEARRLQACAGGRASGKKTKRSMNMQKALMGISKLDAGHIKASRLGEALVGLVFS